MLNVTKLMARRAECVLHIACTVHLREIALAVVRAVVEVDEVRLVGPLELGPGGLEAGRPARPTLRQPNEGRALMQLGQRRARGSERW